MNAMFHLFEFKFSKYLKVNSTIIVVIALIFKHFNDFVNISVISAKNVYQETTLNSMFDLLTTLTG